jgi:hypothetical protein
MSAVQSAQAVLEERPELWIVVDLGWNRIVCCWQAHK